MIALVMQNLDNSITTFTRKTRLGFRMLDSKQGHGEPNPSWIPAGNEVTRRIADSGCNLVDARLSTVGRDVSVSALATGSWDSVAKLETMLTRLEREEGLKLIWYRTGPKALQSNLLPYVVEVIAADKPGILFQLADFFDGQGITIESLHCSRYRAMQTGADMFSAQLTIGVPADMHIAGLRDDFLEFCDHLNLDAIMDPMKF